MGVVTGGGWKPGERWVVVKILIPGSLGGTRRGGGAGAGFQLEAGDGRAGEAVGRSRLGGWPAGEKGTETGRAEAETGSITRGREVTQAPEQKLL